MTSAPPTGELRALLGPSGWLEAADAAPFLVDERGDFRGDALGVARPADTDETAAVVRWCVEHDVAVVTQGGNSGLSGGSVPALERPTVLVSTSRLVGVEAIDRSVVRVGAGTTIQAVQDAAAGIGRLFAPDWGARGSATVGGAIATNAGGVNVIRHGMLRDHVRGLEVVLPDGRVWDGLRNLPKDNAGLDLKHLFIGSEGTLGIVTRATLRLVDRPAEIVSGWCALASLSALDPWFEIVTSRLGADVMAFELVPGEGVERVVERSDVRPPMPGEPAEWSTLLRVGGHDVGTRLAAVMAEGVERGLVVDGVVAATPEQEDNLWALRDELSPSRIFDRYSVKYDLAVPPPTVGRLLTELPTAIAGVVPGARPYAFGHVADGNLHLTVWPGEGDPDAVDARHDELVAAIDRLVWSYGGTISAEHGIGRELVDRIAGQRSPIEWELIDRIRHAIDPDGRMNPGIGHPDL